ncbi:MAG: TolC family protein [Prevotella sp.]|nr:TolC family protein [Prevotella sp.]
MRRYIYLCLMMACMLPASAQRVLTLDSCRAMALRNNKQLNAARLQKDVTYNARKSARTQYLPKLDAAGGYQYYSKEISLLNNSQKGALSNLGTNALTNVGSSLEQMLTGLVQQGAMTPQSAQQLGQLFQLVNGPIAQKGNEIGTLIKDAFRTNTHNIWGGAVMVRQPVFMGGAIIAANRIADINEQLADNSIDLTRQSTLYNIDQAYWTVVSLRQKKQLAESYRNLVKKLDDDVKKMIKEGVATRAEGLKVDVKVNQADMQITQVDNGLSLAKMLLCQLCGLGPDDNVTLADENSESLPLIYSVPTSNNDSIMNDRPELRMLQNTVDISKQNTKLVRAAFLPHVALTGGYLISNPNVFNGFERKFSGVWNVGVTVQVPVWNWFEGTYKVRASKAATGIAMMELSDAREKVQLQVTQSRYKLNEAQKRLAMARKNIKSAEENLRCANIGFKEGVMETTDVMAAQTAWQEAQSQKIDAEVEVKLAQVGLNKALGILE